MSTQKKSSLTRLFTILAFTFLIGSVVIFQISTSKTIGAKEALKMKTKMMMFTNILKCLERLLK